MLILILRHFTRTKPQVIISRGELVQIDGSPFDGFERRAPACTRLGFIDDATGELLELFLSEAETTHSYFLRCSSPARPSGISCSMVVLSRFTVINSGCFAAIIPMR